MKPRHFWAGPGGPVLSWDGAVCLAVLACQPVLGLYAHTQIYIPPLLLALIGLWHLWADRGGDDRGPPPLPRLRSWPGWPQVGRRDWRVRGWIWPGGAMLALALVLALWAVIGLTWSPTGAVARRSAWTLVAVTIATPLLFLAMTRAGARGLDPRWMGRALATGLLAGAVILLGRVLVLFGPAGLVGRMGAGDAQMITFNSGSTLWALLVWPTLWLLLCPRDAPFGAVRSDRVEARDAARDRGDGLLAVVTALVVALAIAASASESGKLALAAGAVAAVAARLAPRAVLVAATLGAALLLMVSPFVVLGADRLGLLREMAPHLPFSTQHRLYIWRFVSERIADSPLVGWGMSAGRVLGDQRVTLPIYTPDGQAHDRVLQLIPLHPHNAALQIWLDLGGIGAAVVALALAIAAWRLARCSAGVPAGPSPGGPADAGATTDAARAWAVFAACVAGALVSGLCVALVSYSLWQASVLSSGCLAAALLRVAAPRAKGKTDPGA